MTLLAYDRFVVSSSRKQKELMPAHRAPIPRPTHGIVLVLFKVIICR
jgi:hypothetical protein